MYLCIYISIFDFLQFLPHFLKLFVPKVMHIFVLHFSFADQKIVIQD